MLRSPVRNHDAAAFQSDLIALIPWMRAVARTLMGERSRADDLIQESILRAWRNREAFEAGTNLRAWVYRIMRNQAVDEHRRARRLSQLDDAEAEQLLVANDNPNAVLELNDVRQALGALPADYREALILVAAGGLSYEEAAAVCNCAVGTIKSRVSRAKAVLLAVLDRGVYERDGCSPSGAFDAIVSEASHLATPQPDNIYTLSKKRHGPTA